MCQLMLKWAIQTSSLVRPPSTRSRLNFATAEASMDMSRTHWKRWKGSTRVLSITFGTKTRRCQDDLFWRSCPTIRTRQETARWSSRAREALRSSTGLKSSPTLMQYLQLRDACKSNWRSPSLYLWFLTAAIWWQALKPHKTMLAWS